MTFALSECKMQVRYTAPAQVECKIERFYVAFDQPMSHRMVLHCNNLFY